MNQCKTCGGACGRHFGWCEKTTRLEAELAAARQALENLSKEVEYYVRNRGSINMSLSTALDVARKLLPRPTSQHTERQPR